MPDKIVEATEPTENAEVGFMDVPAKRRLMKFVKKNVLNKFKPKNRVTVSGNNIYLDGEIVDSEMANLFNGEHEDENGGYGYYPCISPDEFRSALNAVEGDINIFVNSPGGNIWEGARMLTALEDRIAQGGNITLIVDGLCASAATFLLTANGLSSRLITNFSEIMIHGVWVCAMGNAKELREIADALETTDENYARLFANIMNDTSEEEVRELMDAETWFTSQEAVDIGLVDGYYNAQNQAETDAPENGVESGDADDTINRMRLLNIESQRLLLGF